MEPLTEEEKALVEQYQYVPVWVVTVYLGVDSRVVKWAATNTNGVKDLLSELTFGIVKGIRSYDPSRGRSIKSWIVHLCLQHVFKLARMTRKERFREKVFSSGTVEDLYKPLPKLGLSDFVDSIPLRVLTENQRKVIIYRYYHGLLLHEIGEKMGYTKERIRQIQNKALERLKLYILKDLEGE